MSRWLVTAVFLLLTGSTGAGAVQAVLATVDEASVRSGAVAGYTVLKLTVVLAFSFFVFLREPSRRPSRDPVAFVACAVAIVAVVLLKEPSPSASAPLVVVGDLVTLAACAWLLAAVLTLGRCFGVLPEARGLVTDGPYSVVRHPVYLGELGACVGLVLASPTPWNLTVGALFAAAQLVRMHLEETVLSHAFTEYAEYSSRTPRLLPRFLPSRPPSPLEARRT